MADKAVGVQEPTRTEDLGLHTKVLGDLPVLGQSIAGIGPTIGAVSLIALVFAGAGHDNVSWLGDLILLGVTVSFFAAANATLNYGLRVLFTMAHEVTTAEA